MARRVPKMCWMLKSVSANIARKLEIKSELVKSLQELFEIEDDDNEYNTSNYSLLSNKKFHLPKLAVHFKDSSRGKNTRHGKSFNPSMDAFCQELTIGERSPEMFQKQKCQ